MNFNSVIEDRSKVSEWLTKHSIDLVYYEGRFRLPSAVPSTEVPESTLEARGDEDNGKSVDEVATALAT